MKKIRLIKYFCLCFFIAQALFSVTFEVLSGGNNFYPVYTWRIFHTQPDKYLINYEIYIHQIDGQTFSPPQRGATFVEHTFPETRLYTFVKKIQDYAENERNRKKIIAEFDRIFVKDHPHQKVVWEISRQNFNPIEYFWNNRLINEEFLGKHESSR